MKEDQPGSTKKKSVMEGPKGDRMFCIPIVIVCMLYLL
jgi:hypothetical protein